MLKLFKFLKGRNAPERFDNLSKGTIHERIDMSRIPAHIAIIMDGNGRWAQKRGLPRIAGHRAGSAGVNLLARYCDKIGVKTLTLYTFSTENWKRPKDEVNALMSLLIESFERDIDELCANNVRIRILGDKSGLPAGVQQVVIEAENRTVSNTGLNLNLAINYGGRAEIVTAVKSIAREVSNGRLMVDDLTEQTVSSHLYTVGQPDPDLLIRTSGEFRLSNFLLWQLAYTEIVVTDVLWPDFNEHRLAEAIAEYQQRDRRYGGIRK